jgi:hypothetical protein
MTTTTDAENLSTPHLSPAGVIQPNGAKLDVPSADLWVAEDGKIKEFNCHINLNLLLNQMRVQSNFASARQSASTVHFSTFIRHGT